MIYLQTVTVKEQRVLFKILLVSSVQSTTGASLSRVQLNGWLPGCFTDWNYKKIAQPHKKLESGA